MENRKFSRISRIMAALFVLGLCMAVFSQGCSGLAQQMYGGTSPEEQMELVYQDGHILGQFMAIYYPETGNKYYTSIKRGVAITTGDFQNFANGVIATDDKSVVTFYAIRRVITLLGYRLFGESVLVDNENVKLSAQFWKGYLDGYDTVAVVKLE